MKTIFKVFLISFIGSLLLSCSTDSERNIAGNLNIPEEFQGDWTGRDLHRTLHVEAHFITMELPDTTLVVTSATQMVYEPYQENDLAIQNGQYLSFEMFSLEGVLVTLSNDEGEIYQDFYGKN